MRRTLFVLVGVIALVALGCGGSSSPTDVEGDDFINTSGEITLNVGVTVSQSRVRPGETVDLSATVNAVRAETLRFSWVNVTGHGRLVGDATGYVTGPFQIRWEAPAELEPGAVKVEVIQLVVTAISQVISVDESGVQTKHDIATATKTIPITIAALP